MPTEEKFLRDIEVAARYSISRFTVWRFVREDRLPRPVRLAANTVRWRLSDLEAHEANLKSAAA